MPIDGPLDMFPLAAPADLTPNQKRALRALRQGPVTFTQLLTVGVPGIACAWLAKTGLASVTMPAGEKLLTLTTVGQAFLAGL